MERPIRNLDTCYFRAKRDGKWENLCFTDLTEEEQKEVLNIGLIQQATIFSKQG